MNNFRRRGPGQQSEVTTTGIANAIARQGRENCFSFGRRRETRAGAAAAAAALSRGARLLDLQCRSTGIDFLAGRAFTSESAPNCSHVETPRAHRESLPESNGVTTLIVVIRLLARITAVVLAVTTGTGGSRGGPQPPRDNLVTFGQPPTEPRRRSTALRVRRESRPEGRS
jgi:hypothetical protein